MVKAPYSTPLSKIEQFVISKQKWIENKVEMVKREREMLPTLLSGSEIYIAGKIYKITESDVKHLKVLEDILYLPRENKNKELSSFVKKVFLPYILNKTKFVAYNYGFNFKDVKVGSATKKWGSCSTDNQIIYSLSLALIPERLCNYVVVHELCHTLEKNHKAPFYNLMSKILPNYKELQKELKSYAPFCGYLSEKEDY